MTTLAAVGGGSGSTRNTRQTAGTITGSDFLMDGGVTAAHWYGDVAEVRGQ